MSKNSNNNNQRKTTTYNYLNLWHSGFNIQHNGIQILQSSFFCVFTSHVNLLLVIMNSMEYKYFKCPHYLNESFWSERILSNSNEKCGILFFFARLHSSFSLFYFFFFVVWQNRFADLIKSHRHFHLVWIRFLIVSVFGPIGKQSKNPTKYFFTSKKWLLFNSNEIHSNKVECMSFKNVYISRHFTYVFSSGSSYYSLQICHILNFRLVCIFVCLLVVYSCKCTNKPTTTTTTVTKTPLTERQVEADTRSSADYIRKEI